MVSPKEEGCGTIKPGLRGPSPAALRPLLFPPHPGPCPGPRRRVPEGLQRHVGEPGAELWLPGGAAPDGRRPSRGCTGHRKRGHGGDPGASLGGIQSWVQLPHWAEGPTSTAGHGLHLCPRIPLNYSPGWGLLLPTLPSPDPPGPGFQMVFGLCWHEKNQPLSGGFQGPWFTGQSRALRSSGPLPPSPGCS